MTQFWSQKAEILARYLNCQLVFRFERATPLDPPPRAPREGRDLRGPEGVFNSGNFKNDLYFHFRVTPTPTRARGGIPPKIKCYVNSRVSIVGISKMISIFILGYPKPPKGRPQGGLGGQRGFSPLLPKIMCYIDSGVLN